MTRNKIFFYESQEYKLMFLLYLIAIFLIGVSNKQDPQQKLSLHVYPISETKNMTLGHKNSIADSLWLKFLLNDEYCENKDMKKSNNEGKSLDEILSFKMDSSRCDQGWTFQILDFLTDLSPKFREAYTIGGTALVIGVDDREGARIIFEKGLKQYPDDWIMNYRASYVYLFELQQPKRAAELLLNAYKNGGPQFLAVLAARLYSKEGKALVGKTILEQFVKEHPDSDIILHAKSRLKEIEKELPKEKPPRLETAPSISQ